MAYDRRRGDVCDARLEPDFAREVVGHSKTSDGSWRFACCACGADVFGRGGHEGGVIGHFAHARIRPCAYGSAPESDEHRELKTFVARSIADHAGWEAGIEVTSPRWRADVMATEGGFDMDAVFAFSARPDDGARTGRLVVFEIQHTKQSPSETNRRTDRYRKDGCEVVWIFDHEVILRREAPAVRVTKADTSDRWLVVEGLYRRRTVPLRKFVHAVLDGDVRHDTMPGYHGKPPVTAWLFGSDLRLRDRRRERAEATTRTMRLLKEAGVQARRSREEDATRAYAAIVDAPQGPIAIHPWPGAGPEVLARLNGFAMVIPRNRSERENLARAITAPVVLLDEFNADTMAAVEPVQSPEPDASPSQESVMPHTEAADPTDPPDAGRRRFVVAGAETKRDHPAEVPSSRLRRLGTWLPKRRSRRSRPDA